MDLDDIEIDDNTAPDYEISDNFVENLVDVIRSEMVGNEVPFVLFNLGYTTGLFENPKHYVALMGTGSSGSGKSAVKSIVDGRWPSHWLFNTTQTSDKGLIDDDRWNERYIAALDEMNKLPANTLEFLKSSYGDDADEDGMGFTYTRNVDDGDGGRTTDEIKKQAMPFAFLFADENSMNMDWELATRVMEIKVEEDAEINSAVIDTMFDHNEVNVEGREHDYVYKFEDGKRAVDNHIANIPRVVEGHNQMYARPVLIPHDEQQFGWDAAEVLRPIFDPNQSDSKRAAKTVAALVRASTLLNYHNRDIIEVDGTEHYVAEPQDVGNVLACRKTLLGMTHDLDEKKLAVIEALTDPDYGVGGAGPYGGLAAPIKDIHEYCEEHASVTSLSESHLRKMLEDMADRFILTIHENEGENGAHLYEYHGGSTFGHPNLDVYREKFSDVEDPIRKQPITETCREIKEELATRMADDMLDTDPSASTTTESASQSSDDTDGQVTLDGSSADTEWTDIDVRVSQALHDTLDDYRIDDADDELKVQHMVGVSPVEYYSDDTGFKFVKPERPKKAGDLVGTWADPDDGLWGTRGPNQVLSAIENSIGKLRREGMFEIDDDGDGVKYVMVTEVNN